jgi:O-antigen/teichoic acid export membrane protein
LARVRSAEAPDQRAPENLMSLSLASSTLLYLPAQMFGPMFLFATTVIWTHLLDPANFGIVTFVVATQELTALVGLAWWSIFVVRFQGRFADAERVRFRAMDARIVACSVIMQAIMAAPTLMLIGVSPGPGIFFATTAFLATRTVVGHYSEWARAEHRIGIYTIAQLAAPVIGSVLSILAVLAFGADAAVALAAMTVGQLIGLAAVMRGLGVWPGLGKFDADLFVQARRYGLPLLASGILSWIAVNGIRVLIEAKDGIIGVGIFSAGWGLGQRLAVVLAMLCTAAAFPLAVQRLDAGDRTGALRQVSINGALMLGLLAPALAGVTILSRPLVQLLIADQFRNATILILPIAMATSAARMLRVHTGDQMGLLLERTASMTVFNLLDAVLTLSGGGVGVIYAGVIGGALGSLAGTLVASAVAIVFAVRELGLPVPTAALLKVFSATAAMVVVLSSMPPPATPMQLGGQILVGVVVYSLGILLGFPSVWRSPASIALNWRRQGTL